MRTRLTKRKDPRSITPPVQIILSPGERKRIEQLLVAVRASDITPETLLLDRLNEYINLLEYEFVDDEPLPFDMDDWPF